MQKVKIGIIREDKIPVDRRVPLTPIQAAEIKGAYPQVEIVCQSSKVRCFEDESYKAEGIPVVSSVEDCDILLGVKEVPKENLIPGKTYFFFSHTIKKQDYNRELLRKILEHKITMVDYECLTNKDGQRIIAFGRYAGIVGAYNGVYTFGKRYNLFSLRRAKDCFDLEDLKTEFNKVKLPPIKIALTGGGRVAKGAMEVLFGMGIRKVTPSDFLTETYSTPVFTQLNTRDYNRHRDGIPFNRGEFYSHPDRFDSDFLKYARKCDLLIAAAFWDPHAPVLFTVNDMVQSDFRINVIADITCDIEGSIPSTKKPSTIDDPVYDYDATQDKMQPPYSDEGNVTVMAVDNLPCELPRDASNDFGKELINNVLPNLLGERDVDQIIERATIATNGKLTAPYTYLQDYVDGKE